MRWASVMAGQGEPLRALSEATAALAALLGGPPDLVLVFVSAQHRNLHEALLALIAGQWPRAVRLGCEAAGVIAGGCELVGAPGVALVGAVLPQVELRAFEVPAGADALALRELVGVDPLAQPALLWFADPASEAVHATLAAVDQAYPSSVKAGALASGAAGGAKQRLFLGQKVLEGGMIGLALTGDVELSVVVSAGTRAVGPVGRISRALGNAVLGVEGQPALAWLQAVYEGLAVEDRRRFRRGPLVCLGPDVGGSGPRRREGLVRELIGFDRDQQALLVAHPVEVGGWVQLQVRDPASASDDLRAQLAPQQVRAAAGALLLSCVGRGERFYGAPNHESGLIHELIGPVPTGGFFGNGEIGPTLGASWVHRYTAVVALFRAREWS